MYGGNFPNHGHQGHGHHGHHHGHHHQEGFSNQGQGFNVSVTQSWNQQAWQPTKGTHYKLVSGLSSKMVLDVSQNQHELNHVILY
jgi:hypothetical protein